MSSPIHLQWSEALSKNRFRAGVSLHSHTLHSRESLDFIYRAAAKIPPLALTLRAGERRYRKATGVALDLTRGWWTPPLGPHEVWQLERSQLEELDLLGMISITDHDEIEAPTLLQLFEECRHTPISLEWTVPFRATFFHLGIHNLPTAAAREMFAEMQAYRRKPDEAWLGAILSDIASYPETLIVFNHPLWDERGIGQEKHDRLVEELLVWAKGTIHALELNGMRSWRENRRVVALSASAGLPLISGGDRHTLEPNTLVNLTNAGTFAEFVEEVRSGWSDILILRHYREPYTLRLLHNMMDVFKPYDRHSKGWRLWSDRVFYASEDGKARSLTDLFHHRPPAPVALFVGAMELISKSHVRRILKGAFPPTEEVRL